MSRTDSMPTSKEIPQKTQSVTRPLDFFYSRAGLDLPAFQVVEGLEVPEPFRGLLVHANDMTPTLESFYEDEIVLRVLGRRRRGQEYWREVVLLLRSSGQPVEFGANRIRLDRFPAEAQQRILAESAPLGHIMRDFQVVHCCKPNAFLRLRADPLIGRTLELNGESQLYGRHNRLFRPDGLLLSEVVEILRPPAEIS